MALKEATTYIISMANFSFLSLSAYDCDNFECYEVLTTFNKHRNGNEMILFC